MRREELILNVLNLMLKSKKIIEYRKEFDLITKDKVTSMLLNQIIKYWIEADGIAFYKFMEPPQIRENESNDDYIERIKFYKIGESWVEELNEDKEIITHSINKIAHSLNYINNENRGEREHRLSQYQEKRKLYEQKEKETNVNWIKRIDPMNAIKCCITYITTRNNLLTYYNIENPELLLNIMKKIIYNEKKYNNILNEAK